jgi:hypothetical protein
MSKRRSRPTERPNRPGRVHARRVGGSGPPSRVDETALAALLSRIDGRGFDWDDVEGDILPIFERARPFSDEVDTPVQAIVPPGVTVGFGVDLGLAFARVSVTHLADWPVDLSGLIDRALRNLWRRVRRATDYDLVEEPIGGVPAIAFQSRDGWASTVVLLPEATGRLFGRDPALFIAPSRDLLVRLPVDVDLEFATWLTEEFEAADPNALRLEAFEWRDGSMRCRPLARESVAV